MAQDLAFVASLQTPAWAESSDPDEEAVIHSRRVDALVDLDGGELAVDLVQRDDLCLTDGGVMLAREPAWARVAGVRIGLDQAACLARMLISAKEMGEAAEPTSRVAAGAGSDAQKTAVAEPDGPVEAVAESGQKAAIAEPGKALGRIAEPQLPWRGVYQRLAGSERSRSIVRRWVNGAAKVGRSR